MKTKKTNRKGWKSEISEKGSGQTMWNESREELDLLQRKE